MVFQDEKRRTCGSNLHGLLEEVPMHISHEVPKVSPMRPRSNYVDNMSTKLTKFQLAKGKSIVLGPYWKDQIQRVSKVSQLNMQVCLHGLIRILKGLSQNYANSILIQSRMLLLFVANDNGGQTQFTRSLSKQKFPSCQRWVLYIQYLIVSGYRLL